MKHTITNTDLIRLEEVYHYDFDKFIKDIAKEDTTHLFSWILSTAIILEKMDVVKNLLDANRGHSRWH